MSIEVQTNHDKISEFDKNNIINSLTKETKISKDIAGKIALSVYNQCVKLGDNIVLSSLIRQLCVSQLVKRGFPKEAKAYGRIGIPMADMDDIIMHHNTDNANLQRNSETVHKFIADTAAKQYALMKQPAYIAQEHERGSIHQHDMDYMADRPINCLTGDMPLTYKTVSGNYVITTMGEFVESRIDNPEICHDGTFVAKVFDEIYVPSYNLEINKPEWKRVTSVFKKTGQRVKEIQFTKNRNIKCTEDHPFFKYVNNGSKSRISKTTVKCKNLSKKMRLGNVKHLQAHVLPEENPFGRLLGFFLGDGTKSDKKGKQMRFYLKKEGKIRYLCETLNELNISYRINDVNEFKVITIQDENINRILLSIWRNDKRMPSKYLKDEYILGILGGLINSDGYLTINKSTRKAFLEFSSTNKAIMDVFNLSCLLNGITPSYYLDEPSVENWKGIYKSRCSSNALYEVLFKIKLRDEYTQVKKAPISQDLVNRKNFGRMEIKNITSVEGLHDVYDIEVEDNHNFLAGNGYILSHNCCQHDLREFIKHGLKIDGSGQHTSSAGAAKNLETLINHAGQVMMAAQTNLSGGQSMAFINVFMAPFAKGLSYDRIKQAMQMFIFNLNMSYCSRGGQSVFSSINVEMGVPELLRTETAWGPGGKACGVYGDYETEARQIERAITEVLYEGDSMGKPHLFPNTIYVIREEFLEPEYEEDWLKVHKLSAKYSTPYFLNLIPAYNGENANCMGCRTRLNTNWTGNWELDTLRTGNLAMVTINLPRIAYTHPDDFYEELTRVLGVVRDSLINRRKHAEKCMFEYNLSPFISQLCEDGEPYYRIKNSTLSFGFCGMNECVESLVGENITTSEGQSVARCILEFINEYAKKCTKKYGYRFSVIGTPAESTAHRFATLDKALFGDRAIVKGEEGGYYYTNSSHVPVDSDILITERIKVESQYHPLCLGGQITHLYIGENFPDPKALMKFTKSIALKSQIGFWAYTGAFSFCFDCNHQCSGLHNACPHCGRSEKVEWYSRVTGYMQQVGHMKNAQGGWNEGKISELKDRKEY